MAAVCGLVVGRAADASAIDMLNGLRSVLTLALVPFLVVNLIETRRELEWVLGAAVVVVAVKTAFGGMAWLIGAGRVIEGTVLTYYGPLANLLLMAFVLERARRTPARRRPAAGFVLLAGPARPRRADPLVPAQLLDRRSCSAPCSCVLVAVGARGRLLLFPPACWSRSRCGSG